MNRVKPNKNLLVVCHHCEGEGMIPLSPEMQKTLDVALKMKRITASALGKRLGWTGHITAINNRLADLVKHGFFSRRREGRDFVYTPTNLQ